ncbi:DASH family cryptochrome [Pedobacter immunditicola]|uniref:DASH family cryptochrome n=1 Tax=Pedobacter immunditicola TaxID=3133440 RepID=UPI0030B6968E
MKSKKILVWFRNDLRLHDNEILVEAIAKSDDILPVYIFDPRNFQLTPQFTYHSGPVRAKFLLESVAALRTAFQKLGGNLLVMKGYPEELLPELVEKYEIAEVFHHREVAHEETQVSADVEDRLWKIKINLRHFIGHTLYNKEDLPFPIKDIPDVFAQFKKKTERDAIVKSCFLTPEEISFAAVEEWGDLPAIDEIVPEGAMTANIQEELIGGEEAGLIHLTSLLEEGSFIYQKAVLKGTPGKPGFSSKLSAWLAHGCLSPRMVYWKVKEAEKNFGANANFNQILLGLLWRDYFRFMFKKHGPHFFNDSAQKPEQTLSDSCEDTLFEQWKNGTTGNEYVDKYMRRLNSSGFIPHAARLLLSTYLIYILKIDWVKGAAYFEEKSIDYAPANNWCNWATVAGGGKKAGSNKSAFDLNKQFKLLNVPVPSL